MSNHTYLIGVYRGILLICNIDALELRIRMWDDTYRRAFMIFFHVFLCLRIRVYVHVFCTKIVSGFLHYFSCSRIFFVVHILIHTASVISDDLNIVSVQCIVFFLILNSFDVVRMNCGDIGMEQKINQRTNNLTGWANLGLWRSWM